VAIAAGGKKYTVNGLTTADPKVRDCNLNPVWNQQLAAFYGMVYPECNTTNIAAPQGLMYASAGAKVADVRAKIDAHLASSSFGPKDMVTIMVGMNDVLEIYAKYPAQTRDALLNEARDRGNQLADQVNRIANADGRVLVSTIYELGVTPFGLAEKAAKTDIDRAAFLDELSTAFNIAMRLRLINDGRRTALVLADEVVQQISRFPAAFGYTNVTQAACRSDVSVLDCTADTLVTDASATQWLWATPLLMGPSVQTRIGQQAVSRAGNNPF
jgi:outer membrane lipase/esterase